jgi:hypothetical protein
MCACLCAAVCVCVCMWWCWFHVLFLCMCVWPFARAPPGASVIKPVLDLTVKLAPRPPTLVQAWPSEQCRTAASLSRVRPDAFPDFSGSIRTQIPAVACFRFPACQCCSGSCSSAGDVGQGINRQGRAVLTPSPKTAAERARCIWRDP